MDVEKLKARLISLNDDKNNEKIISFLSQKLPYLREIHGDDYLSEIFHWEAEEDCLLINHGIEVTYEFLCYGEQKLREVCDEYKRITELRKQTSILKNIIDSMITCYENIEKETVETVLKDYKKEDVIKSITFISNLINS